MSNNNIMNKIGPYHNRDAEKRGMRNTSVHVDPIIRNRYLDNIQSSDSYTDNESLKTNKYNVLSSMEKSTGDVKLDESLLPRESSDDDYVPSFL